MRANHDTMMVRVMSTIDPPMDRTIVIRSGATLQQVLQDVLDLAVANVMVRVNGRSVSRLGALLPGDQIEISSAGASGQDIS